MVLPLLILLTIALVLLWCLVDRLWDLLLMVTLLFLVIGLTGVWNLLWWLALAVGMFCVLVSFGLDTFPKHLKTHLFGLAYSRQGTHFWVCITFCRVRHGDSVTEPDYFYYYYYYYYLSLDWQQIIPFMQGSNWRGVGGLTPPVPLFIPLWPPNPLVPAVLLALPVHFSQFEPCFHVWLSQKDQHDRLGGK